MDKRVINEQIRELIIDAIDGITPFDAMECTFYDGDIPETEENEAYIDKALETYKSEAIQTLHTMWREQVRKANNG